MSQAENGGDVVGGEVEDVNNGQFTWDLSEHRTDFRFFLIFKATKGL